MELHSKRLHIRTLVFEDWKEVQRLFIDFTDSPARIYDAPLPCDEDGAKNLCKVFADSKMFFAVFLPDSEEMLGYVCFHEDGGVYDMGYLFHRSAHGKGYALEACNELLDYWEKQGVTHFSAHTAMENSPSTRLLGKLGFELSSICTHAFHEDENGEPITFHSGKFLLDL